MTLAMSMMGMYLVAFIALLAIGGICWIFIPLFTKPSWKSELDKLTMALGKNAPAFCAVVNELREIPRGKYIGVFGTGYKGDYGTAWVGIVYYVGPNGKTVSCVRTYDGPGLPEGAACQFLNEYGELQGTAVAAICACSHYGHSREDIGSCGSVKLVV